METLVARLERTAAAMPERAALQQGARRLDYRGLHEAALEFARMLRARGVAPGERVALALPNCIEAVVAWYGCWRAGAVVVPLNAQARERDYYPWLLHSGARLLVQQDGHEDGTRAAAAAAVPVLPAGHCLGGEGGAVHDQAAGETAATDLPPPDPDALAAILYTSGTTGAPKGVALSHRNLAANTASILDSLGLRADDSTVSTLPFYYAYGASVLHTHLAVGARIVLEDNLVFPHLVTEALARERATGFSGVPSTFALLLDRGQLERHDLSSLRYLTQAGGAMAPALARRVRAAFPQAKLFVMYGQTEASARLTCLAPGRFEDKAGSVGTPIAGVEIQVRREDGSRAAPGETGEVWARGDNVMSGYWQAPEATAATLVDGWLRTGDQGHLDPEGYLWLAGRRSDMIKTGAHRVHPQDVEEVIAELPGVREVAVTGIDDALLGQVVAAFLVPGDDAPNEMAVKAHCRQRLAGYKIPKRVAFVSELPKTASGKIRRAALTQGNP
ncbi:long-chain fatty acid--CoA ligase [Luteimonas viscosa]|uniref:Long-chain fatty acid--CoA ligase n=1 Tax=Luteimonas viscosa TaxID=1132694 RepID=A0A5D4XI76_9GAMM|nr:AMP-binding protein [Luteimonas viscosa]TYT23601.1 long-chain fatty acid--CoA ligase [Luteimonas viscosa]